jgi:hypothetical protein
MYFIHLLYKFDERLDGKDSKLRSAYNKWKIPKLIIKGMSIE